MELLSPSDGLSSLSTASIHYIEILSDEMTEFKSTNNQNGKIEHFNQIMWSFNYLLNHLQPSDFKKETVIDFYYFIFDNIDVCISTVASSLEAATTISKINTLFTLNDPSNPFFNLNPNSKISPNSIKEIIKQCCLTFDECPGISTTLFPFLSSLFSKEDYFSKLAKANLFEDILANILFVVSNSNYDKFLFEICFVSAKPKFFNSIPLNSFLSFFSNSVQREIIPDFAFEITAKFVATLVSKVANVSKSTIDLFHKSGAFSAYDFLINKFSENVRPSYYSFFFVSQCELSLVDHLLTLYQKNPKYEQDYFDMVNLSLRSQPEILSKCKIAEWFDMSQPQLKKLCSFFNYVSDQDLKLASTCLPYLLKSMNKVIIKYKKGNRIMNIISSMLISRLVSVEELSQMHFLDVYFFSTTPNCFLELINNTSYLNIYISVYLVLSNSNQNRYFTKICDYINEINRDKFISICSKLISKSPSIDCMKTLFDVIESHKDCYYIKILLNTFLDIETVNDFDGVSEMCLESKSSIRANELNDFSEDFNFDFLKCQRNFIIAGGINWIFSSKILDVVSIVELISHLVSSRSYEQLEFSIQKLDKSHPIFSVDQELMRKMVYGLAHDIKYLNVDLYFRPIRIRSLFPYLKENFCKLNPYNIFFLGNQFVDLHKDIYEVPFIESFGNRCISHKHIPLLFHNVKRLKSFCDDENFDHFPFFVLFCDKYPLAFNISSKSTAVSFWFKIEQKNNQPTVFFQTNNGIKFSFVNQSQIQISIEQTKLNFELIDVSINPLKWTNVFLQISSSFSLSSNVFIYIDSKLIQIKSRKKLSPISNIIFTNQSQSTILYLSNSIRIFGSTQKCPTQIINEIYSKGPSFLGQYEQSCLISPSLKTKNCITIPSNIYLVPYLGFSRHPLSHKLIVQFIKRCKDENLFEEVLETFIKMINLNPKLLTYYELIDIIKNSQMKVSYKMFIRLLTEHIKKFGATTLLLKELIFDIQLTEIYSAHFILKGLFELFPIDLWNKEQIFMMYIVHILLTHSEDSQISDLIMNNLVQYPTLMKYVSSIIKVAPILTHLNPVWSQVEFRENSVIQDILIKFLCRTVTPENHLYYKSFFPFTEVKSLFLVSSDHLCSLLYELITQFHLLQNYFEIDLVFISKLAQLSHIEKVWDCTIQMKHLPSLLTLLWSSFIAFSYFYSNPYDKINLDSIKIKIEESIQICIESIQTVLNTPICLKLFLSLYPFLFTYSSLFSNFNRISDSIQSEPITLSNYQFSDINDDLWFGKQYILSRFNFPASPPPVSYFSFLNQIISSILRNYGFPLPFSFKIQSTDIITDWFARSCFLDLFISLISNCSITSLDSFLYSIVSCEDHNKPFLSTLVHALLTRIPTNSIERILSILDYVSILSSFQLFNQNALILISDLFTVMTIIQSKFSEKESTIVSQRIQPVLMSLFHSIPCSEIKMLFSLLSHHLKTLAFLVTSSNSLHSWLYSFIAFSHNEIEIFIDFINKFKLNIQLNDDDLLILEKISKRQIQNHVEILQTIETEWKEQSTNLRDFASAQYHKFNDEENRLIKEINQLLIDFNYFKYYSNVKHLLLSFFVSQNIRYFEIASSLNEEQICWAFLLRKIKNNYLEFSPKERFMSSYGWPFTISEIEVQSIFSKIMIEQNKAQTIKSDSIKTFKKTIKYQYVFVNDIPLNLFELFKESKGTPDIVNNITMKLDKYEIPCVLFILDKEIVIMTYAKLKSLPAKFTTPNSAMSVSTSSLSLSSNEYDFIPIKECDSFQKDFFLQYCFCGNFGHVELFGSQVCISIKRDSIIHIQYLDKLRIKLWTLFNGVYDLILTQKINIKLKDVFPFNPVPSKEELYQQWSTSQISTGDLFDKLSSICQIQIPNDATLKDKFSLFYGEAFVQKNNLIQNTPKYLPCYSINLDELTNLNLPISFLIRNSISPSTSSIYFTAPNNIVITTSKICCSCIYYCIEIDLLNCALTIRSHSNIEKSILVISNEKFQYAKNATISSNGVFVIIDYSFDYADIFRVLSEKKSSAVTNSSYCLSIVPKSIEKVTHFHIETLYDDIYLSLPKEEVEHLDLIVPNPISDKNDQPFKEEVVQNEPTPSTESDLSVSDCHHEIDINKPFTDER